MKGKNILGALVVMTLITPMVAQANSKKCRTINWTPGTVINVNSAMYLGTRIQLPSDLVTKPIPSNKDLWDVDGAATAVMVKPNSDLQQGNSVIIRAFTVDGNSYDIQVNRVAQARNEACVVINNDGRFFNDNSRAALGKVSQNVAIGQQGAMFAQQNQALLQQLNTVRQNADEDKRKAVMEALRRFRYHIYTRYQWDQGKGFAAANIISDVYDDGRFTYIRLDTPNRGLLSVETEIGGKNAIAPFKYDDAYGMYTINGIYPKFTLRVDDAEINIARADGKTFGE